MTSRPNLLIFLPDAMQAATVSPGHACQTPHLDALAERGVRFTRATTVNPVCSPARASLMTGRLPHSHGVLEVEHACDADQCNLRTQHPHFAQRLSAAGYRTAYFGKWHIERTNQLEDFGWQVNGASGTELLGGVARGKDEPAQLDRKLSRYLSGPEGYKPVLHYGVTDEPVEQRPHGRTAAAAERFLGEAMNADEPWCCCVSFAEPNEALIVGREAYERYDVERLPLPANLDDAMENRPGLYRRVQRVFAEMTEHQWREARACYYGRITELDTLFGRLRRRLEDAGALEQTIVIVVSDHGRYVGAHGFDNHNFGAFEEIYNVPLVVAGPGVAEGQACNGRVSLLDVGPTLLELAGAEAVEGIDGRPFTPLLARPSETAGYEQAYAEYHGTRYRLTQRVVWDGDWKLVYNGFDEDELYHLERDPHELHNLAADPAHAERRRAMMRLAWAFMQRSGDRALLESHYYPMRFAAVGPEAGSGE